MAPYTSVPSDSLENQRCRRSWTCSGRVKSSCHPDSGVCPGACTHATVCMYVMITEERHLCKTVYLLWSTSLVTCVCFCLCVLSLACVDSRISEWCPAQPSVVSEANAHRPQLMETCNVVTCVVTRGWILMSLVIPGLYSSWHQQADLAQQGYLQPQLNSEVKVTRIQ